MNNDIKIKGGNLPEVAEVFKIVMEKPEKMFEMLNINLKERAEIAISELIKLELTEFLGRQKYERISEGKKVGYRNGYAPSRKYTAKGLGTIRIKVPRDRSGEFSSKLIRKYDRYDKALSKDILVMFLSGMSTRNIELFSSQLLGRKISAQEVSSINKEIMEAIEKWRTRDLSNFRIKYLIMDGVNFEMRQGRHIEKTPMLIVIGVTQEKRRIFLTIQRGDKESASTWREIFKDLKQARGLKKEYVQLGIMDGLPGLEKVFREEFSNAKVQRCTVHVARNVLAKVPKSLKEKVSDKMRDIFYASDKKKAIENYEAFAQEYRKEIPDAVNCLERHLPSCLTFYSFPKEDWISLRTTNAIERVNKEFKRRTKPMEILAGEKSAYLLLSFIAYKMELNWKRAPFGKRSYLPKLLEFTQKT
jgi:putative transposase